MRIAFDIDDTLYKLVRDDSPRPFPGVGANCICGTHLRQEVDETMMALAHTLALDPANDVFFWSAGGVEYAHSFIRRFCPAMASLVSVIEKKANQQIDICFDDQPVDLATINLRLTREHADHHN